MTAPWMQLNSFSSQVSRSQQENDQCRRFQCKITLRKKKAPNQVNKG